VNASIVGGFKKRNPIMFKPLTVVSILTMAALVGCNTSSPRGGGMTSADGFHVITPHEVTLQQGAVQTVNLSLDRGDLFKQDVKLSVKATPGISVDPSSTTIKASAGPDALIKLTAAKDAALGEYRVSVTGTPSNGESTMTEFRVKVVTP
jgi:hypothetical protein